MIIIPLSSLLSTFFSFPLLFTPLRVFDTSIRGWFLTGVWVTASPQVYRTLVRILTDLNNAVVWIISTHPLFPSPLVLVPNLWWLYLAHQLQSVSPLLSCSLVFSVLLQDLGSYLSFCFLLFSFCVLPERLSPLFGMFSFFFFFFFFVDYHLVWSSG